MSDPFEFEEEDFELEDEWVEISDVDGHKASLQHLATVRVDDRTYYVLGAVQEGETQEKALMLVREDKTVDGVNQYVIAGDEKEIERVVAHFVLHVIEAHINDEFDELGDEDIAKTCGHIHMPGEFCFCGDPAYLQ